MAGSDKKVYPLTSLMPSSSKIVVSQPQSPLQSSGTCKPQSYKIFVLPPSQLSSLGLIAKNENGKIILTQKSPNTSASSTVLSGSSCSNVNISLSKCNTALKNAEGTTLKFTPNKGTSLQGGSQLGKPFGVVGSSPGTSTRPLYVRRAANRRLLPQFTKHWKSSLEDVGYIRCPLRGCNYISLAFGEMSIHYYQCKGEPYPTKYLCTFCNGRVKSEEELRSHFVVTHSVDGKIAKKQRKPAVVVPKQEEKAQVWIRKRAYSKVHKISWNISLGEKGYVNCFFKNCHFMALNLVEMIQHYGICNGTPSATAVACPYCEGSAESREKLHSHILKSHSNIETIQVVSTEVPATNEAPVQNVVVPTHVNVTNISQPLIVHRSVAIGQQRQAPATVHYAQQSVQLQPAPAPEPQPQHDGNPDTSEVHCLFSMYDEEEDQTERDLTAQIPSSSTIIHIEETKEEDCNAVSCKTYSKTSPKPLKDVEIFHTYDNDVITCTLTENVYTKDYDLEVIHQQSSEGVSNVIVKANPDDTVMQKLQEYVAQCDRNSAAKEQGITYQEKELKAEPQQCSSELYVDKEQLPEQVETIQGTGITSINVFSDESPETGRIFSNDEEVLVVGETLATYSEENSQSVSVSADAQSNSPENYAIFTDYNEPEYPQEYPLENSEMRAGNLDSDSTVEEPSTIQVTTEEKLLGEARGNNTSISYNSDIEEFIIPDMWEPSVNFISTSLSECTLKNKPESSGEGTFKIEPKSAQSQENVPSSASVAPGGVVYPEPDFFEPEQAQTTETHLQDNSQVQVSSVGTNSLPQMTQPDETLTPDISCDSKLTIQAQIQSDEMHREVSERPPESFLQFTVESASEGASHIEPVTLLTPTGDTEASSQPTPLQQAVEIEIAEQDSMCAINATAEQLQEEIRIVTEPCNQAQSMAVSPSTRSLENQLAEIHGVPFDTDQSTTDSPREKVTDAAVITADRLDVVMGDEENKEDSAKEIVEVLVNPPLTYTTVAGETRNELTVLVDQKSKVEISGEDIKEETTDELTPLQVDVPTDATLKNKIDISLPEFQTVKEENKMLTPLPEPDTKKELELTENSALVPCAVSEVPSSAKDEEQATNFPESMLPIQSQGEDQKSMVDKCLIENETDSKRGTVNVCTEESGKQEGAILTVSSSDELEDTAQAGMRSEVHTEGADAMKPVSPSTTVGDADVACSVQKEAENAPDESVPLEEAVQCITRLSLIDNSLPSDHERGSIHLPSEIKEEEVLDEAYRNTCMEVVSEDSVLLSIPEAASQKTENDKSSEQSNLQNVLEPDTCIKGNEGDVPSEVSTSVVEVCEQKSNTADLIVDCSSSISDAVEEKGRDHQVVESLATEKRIGDENSKASSSPHAEELLLQQPPETVLLQSESEDEKASEPSSADHKQVDPEHSDLKDGETRLQSIPLPAQGQDQAENETVPEHQQGEMEMIDEKIQENTEHQQGETKMIDEKIQENTEHQQGETKIIDEKIQENTSSDVTPPKGEINGQWMITKDDYQGFSRLRQLAEECATTKGLQITDKESSVEEITDFKQEITELPPTIKSSGEPNESEEKTTSESNFKELSGEVLSEESLRLRLSAETVADIKPTVENVADKKLIVENDFKELHKEESVEESKSQCLETNPDEQRMPEKEISKPKTEESVEESLISSEHLEVDVDEQTIPRMDVQKSSEEECAEKSVTLNECSDTDVGRQTISENIKLKNLEEPLASSQCSNTDVELHAARRQDEELNVQPDTAGEDGGEHSQQMIASESLSTHEEPRVKVESPDKPSEGDALSHKADIPEESPLVEDIELAAQTHVESVPFVESEPNSEKKLEADEVEKSNDPLLRSKQIFCSSLDLSYNLGPPLKKRHCMGKQSVFVTRSTSVETSSEGYVLGKRKREDISDIETATCESFVPTETETVSNKTLQTHTLVTEGASSNYDMKQFPQRSETNAEDQEMNRNESVVNQTVERHVNDSQEKCDNAENVLEDNTVKVIKESELLTESSSENIVTKQRRKRKGTKEADESKEVAEEESEASNASQTASGPRSKKRRKVEEKKEQSVKYSLRSSLHSEDGSSNSSVGSEGELVKRRRSRRNLKPRVNVESKSSTESIEQEASASDIQQETQSVLESQAVLKPEDAGSTEGKKNISECRSFEGLTEYLGLKSETPRKQDEPVTKKEHLEVLPFDSESSLMSEDSAHSKASSEAEFRSNSSLDMADDSACSTMGSIMGEDDNAVDGDIPSKSVSQRPKSKSRRRKGRRRATGAKRSVSKESEKSADCGDVEINTEPVVEVANKPAEVQCAKCSDKMTLKTFYTHNMTKHNGLSWVEGEEPIDIQNEKLITSIFWRILKNHRRTLTCEDCGVSKKSAVGFLSHINSCNRTAEEREAMKVRCELCDRYMLPTSLKVHLSFHRSMEAKKQKPAEPAVLNEPRSKRAAAERAQSLMQEFIKDEVEARTDDASKKQDADKSTECLYARVGPHKAGSMVLLKWRSALEAEGVAHCTFPGCSFKSKDISVLEDHYKTCKKATKRRFYCEVCEYETKDEKEIKAHVETAHIQGQDADDSDNEPSLGVRRFSYSMKICNKLTFLAKELSGPVVGDKPYSPALKWTLKFLTENCDEPNLFPEYHTVESDWIPVPNCDVEDYLPKTKESISFAAVAMKEKIVDVDSVELQWKRHSLFHSELIDGVPSLFIGGPIWGLAWCPLPVQLMGSNNKAQQFLAVSCHRDMEDMFSSNESVSAKGLIQIWNCDHLDNITTPSVPPKFAFGIAHNYGAVWGLEWCLSGCYDMDKSDDNPGGKVRRLGLLAAACSDGTVRVFSVCFPDNLPETDSEYKIYKPEPAMTLILDEKPSCKLGGLPWSCLRLSWYKGKHHKIIAGGFSNGMVALWNIGTTSPLLSRMDGKTRVIYPYHTFQAHSSCVTALSLAPQHDGRYLMTGSTDMTVKVWDMEDVTGPISPVYRRGMVTDGVWLTHWLSTVTSYDDVYNMGHSNSTLNPPRRYGFKVYPLLAQNSVAWSLSANDWMNAVAQTTHAGELTAIFPHQLILNVDTEKGMKDKRMVLSYVELKNFSEENSAHVCSTLCTAPCSKQALPSKKGKDNTGAASRNLNSQIVEDESVNENDSGISFLIVRNARIGKSCVIIPFSGSEDIENLPSETTKEEENAEEEAEENKIPECLSVLDEHELKLILGFKRDLEKLNVSSKLKITFPYHKNEKKRSNSNDTVQEYLMVVGPVEDKNKTEEDPKSSQSVGDALGTSDMDSNFSKVIRFNPSQYEAVAKKFGMIFCYFPADDMASIPPESRIWMRKSECMRTAAVEMYPITSLNKVQWNPNCRSCLWLAAGYQCGILRLSCISGMHTKDTEKFMAQSM